MINVKSMNSVSSSEVTWSTFIGGAMIMLVCVGVMGAACSMYGTKENAPTLKSENLKERNHAKNVKVHGRIILKCNFKKNAERVSTGLIWFPLASTDRI
jgi:hypothetical protein